MANFLFWNTNRKALATEIALACRENDVDVLILAEYRSNLTSLLLALNAGNKRTYIEQPFNLSERLHFVFRYPVDSIRSVHDEGGIAIRSIRPPVGIEILLIALHLPSKLHRSRSEQALYAVRLAEIIRDCEDRVGHANSVIMGDLNMDPFEDGLVAADGIHGVMDKTIARQLGRIVDGRDRKYFYNPMWNYLGDESDGPPGTYYRRGGQISQFWHTFDQVLLRPAMLPCYSRSGLRVLTKIGNRELLTNDRIDTTISDHLPIFLDLALDQGGANDRRSMGRAANGGGDQDSSFHSVGTSSGADEAN